MQKRYSKEFKETLIAFYHSGQSVTQLSKEYDVAPLARNLSLSKDVVSFYTRLSQEFIDRGQRGMWIFPTR